MTTLGILGGTGPQGRGLAVRLAMAGYACLLGSRDAGRGRQVAAEVARGHGLSLDGGGNAEVADRAEIVLITVPYEGLSATLDGLANALAGKLVVSCVNPTVVDDAGPYWKQPEDGSAAEECQRLLPGSRMVAALHSVSAKKLLAAAQPVEGSVPVCGDDPTDREEVIALVDAIPDLRGLHAGALRLSFALEAMTSVLIAANQHYRRSMGFDVANPPPRT